MGLKTVRDPGLWIRKETPIERKAKKTGKDPKKNGLRVVKKRYHGEKMTVQQELIRPRSQAILRTRTRTERSMSI